MHIYLLKSQRRIDYEMYDSMVVVAENYTQAISFRPIQQHHDNEWPKDLDGVTVACLGQAFPGTKPGIVVASYNAA